MSFRALADLVLMLHLGFIVFVAAGALVVRRWPSLACLHVPAVGWGVFIEYSGRLCPLTPLEVALRRRGGEAGYAGDFIDRYVTALIYPEGLTRGQQVMLGSVALAINLLVYGSWIFRAVGRRPRKGAVEDPRT